MKKESKKKKDGFQELIKESGHNLHLEVVDFLEGQDWEVEISPYYYDGTMEKVREVDIVASKPIRGKYRMYLFIECKHFNKKIVLWHREITRERIKEIVINSTGGGHARNRIQDFINSDSLGDHHYFKHRTVAKLFYTKQRECGPDVIFNAFTQSIQSLSFFKEKEGRTGIFYPIVIYDPKGKVAICSKNKPKGYELINNFLLDVNYSYRGPVYNNIKIQRFLIDFIAKDYMSNFFKIALASEINEMAKFFKEK